ncbi:PREDICTED: interactor protein for cytohesin exchange factors 1-like [Priapulus caudatus]|uniref:Interactor protein for cytohesin exchange factors 1-like n=1 Tax=Priapulus caudatus TaxID=37621 RepID=A0ABM1F022_PRICU|nr:PREDICTED: interactor protein for cytohesin exchange factors 1-like [Priapulus caudatus]
MFLCDRDLNLSPSPCQQGDRRISCQDLGNGECEGWLHRRRPVVSLLQPSKWMKRWCVLKDSNMFCYKCKDDIAADSVIFLPGFNVSPAPEIKTKKSAFKIHHKGAAFYFASDRQSDLSK